MGIGVAKAFLIVLLTVVIIGTVSLIVLNSLEDATDSTETLSASVANETGGYINTTGYTLDNADARGFSSVAVTEVLNNTGGEFIEPGNYSISAAGVLTSATVVNYSDVNISYTYNYIVGNEIESTVNNASGGIAEFFTNTTTWLALLSIIIIILIISMVILVVNRFGSDSGSTDTGLFNI